MKSQKTIVKPPLKFKVVKSRAKIGSGGLIFRLTLTNKVTFLSTLPTTEKHSLSGLDELEYMSTICNPLPGKTFASAIYALKFGVYLFSRAASAWQLASLWVGMKMG